MIVLLYQHPIFTVEPKKNRDNLVKKLVGFSPAKNSLLLLPEMFSTGFIVDSKMLDSSVYDDDIGFFSKCAEKFNIYILGSTYRYDNSKKGFNYSLLFSPSGELIGKYKKVHPFSFVGEDQVFSSGSELKCFKVNDFNLFPTICYDLRFPELYRAGLYLGYSLITVQANWPSGRMSIWETLLKARAIENQCWVVAVNRIAGDKSEPYIGGSMVISPTGDIIADVGSERTIFSFNIEKKVVNQWREKFTALKDRKKAEFYTNCYEK